MRRASRALIALPLAVVAGALLFGFAAAPRRALRVEPASWHPRAERFVVRGAYHVHTARSDGTGSLDSVAAAAARAGLDFVVFTDHGDASRAPEPPAYRSGVLCVDAVEISTTGGHYAALGMGGAPYRLAGDAAGVVEDVRRLGGLGIVTHPDSPKRSLRWRDWDLPIDGFEWLNADSEWRDEGRGALARAMLHYPWRGPETLVSLFDRPETTLRRWDEAGRAGRRLIALAGMDAHARLGPRGTPDADGDRPAEDDAMTLEVPSHETVFRALTTRVALDDRFGGDAKADAARLLEGIRRGRVFTVLDGIAGPGGFEFAAESPGRAWRMGDALPAGTRPLRVRTRTGAPPGSEIRLLRNGEVVARSTGVELVHDAAGDALAPEIYRAEVHVPGAPGAPPVPWIVGNGIYVGAVASRPVTERAPGAGGARDSGPSSTDDEESLPGVGKTGIGVGTRPGDRMDEGTWKVETSPGSKGEVRAVSTHTGGDGRGSALEFTFELSRTDADAFTAIARRLPSPPSPDSGILLRASADAPVRMSVQLRVGDPQVDRRWRRSVYLDSETRELWLPLSAFTPVRQELATEELAKVDSLLLVVDRTNSLPGAAGTIRISYIELRQDGTGGDRADPKR